MLYGEILMPLFQLHRLKGAASRRKMDSNQVNYPTGGANYGGGKRNRTAGKSQGPIQAENCIHIKPFQQS